MKPRQKALIALLLTAVLLLSMLMPAFAAEKIDPQTAPLSGKMPIIKLKGDGAEIYDEDGNLAKPFILALRDMISGDNDNEDSDTKGSAGNILKSFALAILAGKYDEYYALLQQEISEMSERIQMDENGDPKYGTDISDEAKAENQRHMTTPNVKKDYDVSEYVFNYDWRRSPLEIADELDEFIESVCAMTGFDQVAMFGRCLGANFVVAYLAKYGYKNRLHGIGLEAGMMYGHTGMSESISGKFQTDGDAINRYLTDQEEVFDMEFSPWIKDLIDYLEASGILRGFGKAIRITVYKKMVEGVSSALALGTYFTIPSYWACVSLEDYDTAMQYVFGKEGSEKRKQYAGLIEKIEAYHQQVQLPMDELLKSYQQSGGNVAVISKYGFQMTPICKSRNLVSDDYTSVRFASLGATTSMLYNTLSADYIAAQKAKGLDRYLSPDRQVDASTCLFPDNTWFIKGLMHGDWSNFEEALMAAVMTADRQLTTDDFSCTQFVVHDKATSTYSPMTADNNHTENWTAIDPDTQNVFTRLVRCLHSARTLLHDLLALLKEKIAEKG